MKPNILLITIAVRAVALAMLITACQPDAPPQAQRRVPVAGESAGALPIIPVAQIPREVRSGVCPFECCRYGEWIARGDITVYAREGDTTEIAYHLTAGDTITAVTGNVHLSPPGLAVVTKSVKVGESEDVVLNPGDTIDILESIGEGYYMVKRRGVVLQAYGFFALPGEKTNFGGGPEISGVVLRKPSPTWWVEVTLRTERQGWILMSDEVQVSGADGCGD